MRLTPRGKINIVRGLRRSWEPGGSHDLRFRSGEPDADTLRQRAAHDRRGRCVLAGRCGRLGFAVCHSTAGRTDQYDIFLDGQLVTTIRSGLVLETLLACADATAD